MNETSKLEQMKTPQHCIVGYKGTGYEFHVLRCKTEAELREHFKFRGMTDVCRPGEPLHGFTAVWTSFGLVCEVHVAVVETGDEREDVRRWAHEIQHAATFVGRTLDPKIFDASRLEELPALSAELLADTVLLMARGLTPGTCPESGFPNAFNGTRKTDDDGTLERKPAGAEAPTGLA